MGSILLNIVIVIALSTVTYLYWRNLKFYFGSAYKAFDVLFLSLLFFVVFARLAGLFIGLGTDYQVIQIDQLITVFGVRFEYLLTIFTPLLAFQFMNMSIEIREGWKNSAHLAVVFGNLILIAFLIFDVLQLSESDPESLQQRIPLVLGLILSSILVCSGIWYLKKLEKLTALNLGVILLIQQFVLQVVIWLFAYISAVETARQSIVLLIFFFLSVWPVVSGEMSLRNRRTSTPDQIRDRINRVNT